MSASMKYALVQIFCIPFAEVEDSDRTTIESGQKRTMEPREIKKSTAPMPQTITVDQAKKLHMRFGQNLPPDCVKNADAILEAWFVKRSLTKDGRGSAMAIPSEKFAEVGKAAVAYAKALALPAQNEDEIVDFINPEQLATDAEFPEWSGR